MQVVWKQKCKMSSSGRQWPVATHNNIKILSPHKRYPRTKSHNYSLTSERRRVTTPGGIRRPLPYAGQLLRQWGQWFNCAHHINPWVLFLWKYRFFPCRDRFSRAETVFQTAKGIFPGQNPSFPGRIRFSGTECNFHAREACFTEELLTFSNWNQFPLTRLIFHIRLLFSLSLNLISLSGKLHFKRSAIKKIPKHYKELMVPSDNVYRVIF